MPVTRLEIGSNENVGYFTDVSVHLIYQISDIREPDKRKGTRSFTIKIPMSQENNILFENIFEANISLQNFNPHLKTTAKYYIDELIQFKGYAQLLNISYDETAKTGEYEISLIGEIITLFSDIANLYLTDLDFSAYDHDLTYAQISGSWGALGNGFVYPMVDWGTNNSNLQVMTPTDWRAALFIREYLDKIFTDAGYTWTSTFLDSTFFQKLILLSNSIPQVNQSTLDDNKFLATTNGSQSYNLTANFFSGNTVGWTYSTLNTIQFQAETYDQNNLFATPDFTVPNSTKYDLSLALPLNFKVTRNAVDVTASITPAFTTGIHVIIYNVTTSTIAGLYDLDILNNTIGSLNTSVYQAVLNLSGAQLTAGDVYRVVIKDINVQLLYTAPTAAATWVLETYIGSGGYFGVELSSAAPFEGATVPGNSLVPAGIKQTDFISSLIKMFRLQFMIDPNDSNNYFIEPGDDFISTTEYVDWTYKHDQNAITEIIPLGDLTAKTYRATYKQDGDYYNKTHADYYKNLDGSSKVYGTYETEVEDDFIKGQSVIEVLFGATPYNKYGNIIAPAIIKKENNTVSQISGQPRILYYSGSLSKTGISWKFVYNDGANSVTYTSYPHAGHSDDPYAPTLDLNFGLPVKLYFTYLNLYWTTNNLWNKYHSVDFSRRTDKNSKMVITDFFLNANDIHSFDFRKPVFWKDAYYTVNKLDYNPNETTVTRAELLKLTKYDPFVPTNYLDTSGFGNENVSFEKVKKDNITTGDNNFNDGNATAIIGGSGNVIANSSSNSALINCNNCSVIGAENFTAINANDKVFDYTFSNSTFNGDDEPVDITSDTTIDLSYNKKVIVVDASGGDVTITVDQDNSNGLEFCLIIKDIGANQVFIDSSGTIGTENYIGNGLPYDLAALQYDTYNFKVIGDTIYNKE